MIICHNCRKEMRCIKNGIGARWGRQHVYIGDLFECTTCKSTVLSTNSNPINDEYNKILTFQMEKGYNDNGTKIENFELEQLELFSDKEGTNGRKCRGQGSKCKCK